MPLDAVCLLATVREINARTAEGRIDENLPAGAR